MLNGLGNALFHIVVFVAAALYIEQNIRVRLAMATLARGYATAEKAAVTATEAVAKEAKKLF